jgi:hypothetical protein
MSLRKSNGLAFQGDIALLKIDSLPAGAERVTQKLNSADREAYGYHPVKGLVLAQGESRNHFHAFRDTDSVEMYRTTDAKPRLFLVINKPQVLVHEEHDPIEIEDGVHELFFQSEYTFEEEYRRVAD